MELFFVTFYAANSLMKLEYWKRDLSIAQACDVYSRLIKEYTGFGRYQENIGYYIIFFLNQ